MTKQCVILESEVKAEHLTQSHGLFIQKDLAGHNWAFMQNYIKRRLRECGIELGKESWRKFKDVHGQCVWIAEQEVA
jgi:hypothetical protein